MSRWTLTSLQHLITTTTLHVLASTSVADHLFMSWALYRPAQHPIWRTVRGKDIFCGYKYIWDTPNLEEQTEPGDTLAHSFYITGIPPGSELWYYLHAPNPPSPYETQGPLMHVLLPEAEMPSARIFNSLDQPIPTNEATHVRFDSVQWDDGGFYDPAAPTRLTILVGALYAVGCCIRLATELSPGARVSITRNGPTPIVMHSHRQIGLDWPGAAISLHTITRLQPGDYLNVDVFHYHGHNVNVLAHDNYSPHFWIAAIGPYPV